MKKLFQTLKLFAKGSANSIRQMAYLCGWPYETTRRWIKGLASEKAKEGLAQWVLNRWARDQDVVVVAIDPTYIKGFEKGIIVACLVLESEGRSIPLWWESFSWKNMDDETGGLFSRNTFQRNFALRLKELVYPRTLIIIADREFGRKAFIKFLFKKGIYWVIRHPKHSWPPPCGDGIEAENPKEPSEPYLLSYRLPYGCDMNPISLYLKRMSIEETFKDAKSMFWLTRLLGRVKDKEVKGGLLFLVFASLVFTRAVAEELRDSNVPIPGIPKGFLGLLKRKCYSIIYFGRYCLKRLDELGLEISSVAPRTCAEIRLLWEV